jgi:hypothetical protein
MSQADNRYLHTTTHMSGKTKPPRARPCHWAMASDRAGAVVVYNADADGMLLAG